jgi:hypothetical protein
MIRNYILKNIHGTGPGNYGAGLLINLNIFLEGIEVVLKALINAIQERKGL